MKRILLVSCCLLFACCHSVGTPPRTTPGEPLAPCPDSPNCVSSLARDDRHRVGPLSIHGSAAQSMSLLRRTIESMPRARVTFSSERMLQAEFRSLLGFVDDLACIADEKSGLIHVRSASRVGYWDLGVNRRRVERVRALYEEAAQK